MRASPILTVLVVSLALTACGKKKKPAGPPPVEELCATSCERINECNADVEVEQCRLDCIESFKPYGDRLRGEFVDEIEQCMLDSRCRDLGETALDNSCRRDATERLGVSLTTVKMCKALDSTLTRCQIGQPGNVEGCQQAFKILNDETLEASIACSDVECKELGGCFASALGFSSPLMPGITSDSDERE